MRRFGWALGVVFGMCALQPAFAAPPTVTFNLTGVNSSAVLAGVYTSPYSGNVNGGATLPVVCDDFTDNSYIPEEWTAYQTSLSSVPTATTDSDTYLKWGSADSDGNITANGTVYTGWNITNQQEAYTIAAYLDLEILNATPASTNQEDLSYALWEFFDANGVNGTNLSISNWGGTTDDKVVSWLSTYQTNLQAATIDVENAITAYNNNHNLMAGYNVTIYSYDSGGMTPECGTPLRAGACSSLPPQEFMTITAVPEASTVMQLGLYLLLGGAGFVFFSRRRASGSAR